MNKAIFSLLLNVLVFNALSAQTPGEVLTRWKSEPAGQDVSKLKKAIDAQADAIEPKLIAWRRDFHQNPELSNREQRTAGIVAEHLKKLGLEVKTGVGKTGVVGVLRGGKPGGVIALRADMDALPVVERNDLPFKSIKKDHYLDQEVGVMHACGHDAHVAMLMGAAEMLAPLKADLPGTVVFVFQPAEEGPPPGEEGGAPLMIKERLFEDYGIQAFFGIHISSLVPVGTVRYKPGGAMAAADRFTIKVKGKGSHGSTPWLGTDPIVAAAYIIANLQTVVSRQTELTKEAAVVTVGKITAGTRHNIIPEDCEMLGTIRTLDPKMREKLLADVRRVVENTAEAQGCAAELIFDPGLPITFNNEEMTRKMLPSIAEAAGGEQNVQLSVASTGSEDFSFYAQRVPSVFVWLGAMPKGKAAVDCAPHHTSGFFIDESSFKLGARLHCYFALDWLAQRPSPLPTK